MSLNAAPQDRQLALAPLDENFDHVRGAPVGRLIIEYGDYECPYSRQAFRAIVLQRIQRDVGGTARSAGDGAAGRPAKSSRSSFTLSGRRRVLE